MSACRAGHRYLRQVVVDDVSANHSLHDKASHKSRPGKMSAAPSLKTQCGCPLAQRCPNVLNYAPESISHT